MTSPAVPDLPPLHPLEIAAGLVLESTARRRPPPPAHEGRSARQALEHVVLSHLQSGRSSVSFSGGRDSSLVLAVACHVARREGFPDPVAITLRHRSPQSDERAYQELVIEHLGVDDWVTVDVEDTMDVVGPDATATLELTGVQAPPNAYLHLTMAKAAPRGTLMTGGGGDEYLGSTGGRAINVLSRRVRPRTRDLVTIGYALAPYTFRYRREARRPFSWAPWLTPAAERAVRERRAAATAHLPARWDTRARIFARSRNQALLRTNLRAIGGVHGVNISCPLSDPVFVDAWAYEMGGAGPDSRTQAMYRLGADLLPNALLERRSKAIFGGVIWGPYFRRFAERSSQSDFSPEVLRLIDFDRLAAAWAIPKPPHNSMMLVQHAWLTARERGGHVLE